MAISAFAGPGGGTVGGIGGGAAGGGTGGLFGAQLGLAGLSAIQSFSQARAARTQGKLQRRAIRLQEQLQEVLARDAIKRGKKQELQFRQSVRKLIGAQRVSLAAQGIEIGTGSAADIQQETALLGALDALTIRNNAFREAAGFKLGAAGLATQRSLAGFAAQTEMSATLTTGGLQFGRDVLLASALRRGIV